MSEEFKDYLGDSVYAALDNGIVKLTTENGYVATNVIFLEPTVYEALVRWEQRVTEELKRRGQQPG